LILISFDPCLASESGAETEVDEYSDACQSDDEVEGEHISRVCIHLCFFLLSTMFLARYQ
jgi:hypothetical protein